MTQPAWSFSRVLLGLLLWSATSQQHGALQPSRRNAAIGLLAVSALVRLMSQVLAINTIGAICLIVDVYALGVLLQLDQATPRGVAVLARGNVCVFAAA